MKEKAVTAGFILLCICVVGATYFGMVEAIKSTNYSSQKKADANCSLIAKESGASDWRVDSSYNCIMIKNNKLITVEDW